MPMVVVLEAFGLNKWPAVLGAMSTTPAKASPSFAVGLLNSMDRPRNAV